MEAYLSTIMLFGANFAPRGWMTCNGQIISIAQNTALFSLLGTTFGGNGQTTFALPNFASRVPIGMGTGPGLSNYQQGQLGGVESTTITTAQMPMHTHVAQATSALYVDDQGGDTLTANPVGNYISVGVTGGAAPAAMKQFIPLSARPANAMAAPSVGTTVTNSIAGGSQPLGILPPYLGTNFIIAVQGIFPSRN